MKSKSGLYLRVIYKTLMVTGVLFLVIVGGLYAFQRNLLYFPRPNPPAEVVAKITEGYEEIKVSTADGLLLTGYFHPPLDKTKPVIVAFHGNAALAVGMAGVFRLLVDAGYGVLLAEYRGYGGNPGKPGEEELRSDAMAYIDWVRNEERSKSNPLVLYGQSLGSGVVVDLASRLEQSSLAAVILEVPFLSIVDVSKQIYPFVPLQDILVRDTYRSDLKIESIAVPKLFLLAGRDEVVGFAGGQQLYELAKSPKMVKIYPDATHGAVYLYGAAYDVADFIAKELGQ